MKRVEQWKESEYKGLLISNIGNFMRKDGGRLNIILEKENGYLRLSYKGMRKRCHVLVAETWLPKPTDPRKKIVHHINGDKRDNRASNLEWRTPQENTQACANEGKLATTAGIPTPIIARNVMTGELRVFHSQAEAAEAVGRHNSSINKALRGCRKSCAGYEWFYLADIMANVA